MHSRTGRCFSYFLCSAFVVVAVFSGFRVKPGMTGIAVAHAAPADTDGDGLSDELEIRFGSRVDVADTDGDGFADGHEVENGYSPTSAAPTKLTKQIVIDISAYRLSRYLGGVKLDEHLISPGVARLPTPTGNFTITKKYPKAWSRSAKLWMPWWMNFTGPRAPQGQYGIHELPIWPGGRREGERSLGRPASHGCVRLGIGPAKMLYDWTPEGTKVVIRKSEKVVKM